MPFGTWVFQYGTCIIRVNLGPLRCVERTYKWSSGLRPRQVLKSDRKWKWQSYELDILQPFSVILMRLICINLSWIKSYGINQIFFLFHFLFQFCMKKKIRLINGHFSTISGHFSDNWQSFTKLRSRQSFWGA